jgi:peptide deformylase
MKAKVLRITQLGEPVLRKVSKPVPLPLSKARDRFVDDMIVTMKKAKGVGIAAPQVNVGLRMFIVAPEPSARYPKAPKMAPVAMINPVLVKHSKKKVTDWEGCLSIPGLRGRVPRYHSIEIEFTDRLGRRLRGKLSGFVARIFQHEFDHINGRVYVDRVVDTRTFMTETEYRRRLTPTLSHRERAQRSGG